MMTGMATPSGWHVYGGFYMYGNAKWPDEQQKELPAEILAAA